jgi:glycosyltransferase involved in cell wall biosynthesis
VPEPTPLLVVARWFPAHDEPGRGAFVANQIEALRDAGAASPTVITFDDVRLAGSRTKQHLEAEAILNLTAATAGQAGVVSPAGANGPAHVPVLRLRVPHFSADVRLSGQDGTWHARATTAAAGTWPTIDPRSSRGIVHVHETYPDGVAALELARITGRPMLVTEHASYVADLLAQPDTRAAFLAVARAAFRLIVVSETLAGRMRAAAPELERHLVVVPNAIPTDRFRLADPAGRHRDELLYVGARRVEKGTDRLLDTFALVRRARPNTILRLIGSSPHGDAEWQARAAELGIADAVSFEPQAQPELIAQAMASAGLFVHPSPAETFGVVAAEALATGLPVVATDSGGVTEIVGPGAGRLGETVVWDGPAALAAAIARTLDRAEGFDPAALRQSIVDRYDARRVASQLAELYAEAVAQHDFPTAGREPPAPSTWKDAEILAVGLNRRRLPGRLPAWRDGGLDVVSSPQPPGWGGGPVESARLREVDTGAALRRHRARMARLPPLRAIELVRHGRGTRSDRAHDRIQIESAARAVEEAAQAAGAKVLLPLDGNDGRVVDWLVRRGQLAAAPGGLRWLADQALVRETGPA